MTLYSPLLRSATYILCNMNESKWSSRAEFDDRISTIKRINTFIFIVEKECMHKMRIHRKVFFMTKLKSGENVLGARNSNLAWVGLDLSSGKSRTLVSEQGIG